MAMPVFHPGSGSGSGGEMVTVLPKPLTAANTPTPRSLPQKLLDYYTLRKKSGC